MTGLEIIALASGLLQLAQKVQTENREATEAEVEAALAGADAALDSLEAAIRRKREQNGE